jgi:hypothetical protein
MVVLEEMEALAKRLRTDLRRAVRKSGLPTNLERAADALRKRAVLLARLIEKYAHEVRMELAPAAPKRRQAARRKMMRVA